MTKVYQMQKHLIKLKFHMKEKQFQVFTLTHVPKARASKTGFEQVKIMKEFV